MTIENYGPNGMGPRGQYDYSSTAFWYQSEVTPPFEQLRGVKFTGGDDPDGKPVAMEYTTHPFPDLNADNLRTYGLGITFAQQAEVLLADPARQGKAKIVTDALRPYEFDRERAVDFGTVTAGQKLAGVNLNVASDGVYQLRVYTAPEKDIAEISIQSDGRSIPVVSRPEPRVLQLGAVFLRKGECPISFVAATAGHAILDCFQLKSVPRSSGAIEAEELTIVWTTGGAAEPIPSQPLDGVSAGRVLQFHSERTGQGFVLNLGKRPSLPYVLGVRPMVGPGAAIIQAFADDKPIGPQFDLYAATRKPGSSVLPLGSVPAGISTIEIRAVGRNPSSQGGSIDLDYFRWEPSLLGPGTADGIWAQVIATHGCEYRPQDLGPTYSGGHQFWVQPCNRNGWVDIALEIPRAGTYEIVAKYTKSWDYAKVQAFADRKPLGPVVDTFSPTVEPAEPITLDKLDLTAGRHVLRFQAVDHNPESKGYLMGIDHVIVR